MTRRQYDILVALCQPMSLLNVAKLLGVSPKVVIATKEAIASKIGAANNDRVTVVITALKMGYVDLEQISLEREDPPE